MKRCAKSTLAQARRAEARASGGGYFTPLWHPTGRRAWRCRGAAVARIRSSIKCGGMPKKIGKCSPRRILDGFDPLRGGSGAVAGHLRGGRPWPPVRTSRQPWRQSRRPQRRRGRDKSSENSGRPPAAGRRLKSHENPPLAAVGRAHPRWAAPSAGGRGRWSRRCGPQGEFRAGLLHLGHRPGRASAEQMLILGRCAGALRSRPG